MAVALPTKEALLDAMELTKNSKDGAEYLALRFEETLAKAKVGDEANDLKDRVHSFAKNVSLQQASNPGVWSGSVREPSLYRNMHENLADESTSFLEQNKTEPSQNVEFQLDFAINDNGEFLRGYNARTTTGFTNSRGSR